MIEVKGLKYYYEGKKSVLHNINFSIPDRQIVGVFGENGAGKTTLLKNIMGIYQPAEGEVLIDGKSPKKQYHDMALITEAGSYFPEMTPMEYGEFLREFFPYFDMDYYKRLLLFFEMEGKPIKKMSKGQKARAEIAAGLSKRAKYIIMDEPFTGKDIFTRQDFLKMLSGSLKGHETILVSTHEIDEIENLIDRALILHKGQLAADISMDNLQKKGETLVDFMKETMGYKEGGYQKAFE